MPRIALVTAFASAELDDDLPLLLDACARAGLHARICAWDDAGVVWGDYDVALLRSPWDYTQRLPEFLDWCERISGQTCLLNPLPVVQWNTDKHYLADLASHGVPTISTVFVEPGMDAPPVLQAFLEAHPGAAEFVVKPTVGAGSRDAQRYRREQATAAMEHLARLLDQGRSAMLQPYLPAVDRDGETGMVYIGGQFSHAIRKGALLAPDQASTSHLFAAEAIVPREPSTAETALADQVLNVAQRVLGNAGALAYARVDMLKDELGRPTLLELELCEPSLFLVHAPGAAERVAAWLGKTFATSDAG